MQDFTLNKDSDNILGRYGNTQYFWRMEQDNCILYAIDDNEIHAKQLAIFPPMVKNNSDTASSIIDFGVCGDWLIASVGHYEGSGHYFYGDFVRLKKDGSGLKHFYLTDDDTFSLSTIGFIITTGPLKKILKTMHMDAIVFGLIVPKKST